MVFSDYTKQRILSLSLQGFKVTAIVECLVLEDEILVSKHGVRQFLKRYRSSGTIARKPGSGLPPKLSPRIEKLIEDIMRNDDETTATQLQGFLANCSVMFLWLLLSEIDVILDGFIAAQLIVSLFAMKTK